MPSINVGNKVIKGVNIGSTPANMVYFGSTLVYNRTINQDWVGSVSGTDIWGKANYLSGYTGTQTSTFTFTNPQEAGVWSLSFTWSGQAYVTSYGYAFEVTYSDNTTATLFTGNLSEYTRGGSGTKTQKFTMTKPWKKIKASHWRSILDTIYCYSNLGNVQMDWKGSYQG